MTSGLVHEIDAKVTLKGRQKRVTFPHKLFMDYLAAWYICSLNIEQSLKQAFPTWNDVVKHKEVVRACCRLMKGRDEVIMHFINVLKLDNRWHHVDTLLSYQNECGLQTAYIVKFPSHGLPLSKVLNSAKLVVIEKLTDEGNDDDLPCNADIAINIRGNSALNSGFMRTLQRHRDHIITIYLRHGSQDVMEQMSTLLPSSSLGCLHMTQCYIPEKVVNRLHSRFFSSIFT